MISQFWDPNILQKYLKNKINTTLIRQSLTFLLKNLINLWVGTSAVLQAWLLNVVADKYQVSLNLYHLWAQAAVSMRGAGGGWGSSTMVSTPLTDCVCYGSVSVCVSIAVAVTQWASPGLATNKSQTVSRVCNQEWQVEKHGYLSLIWWLQKLCCWQNVNSETNESLKSCFQSIVYNLVIY